MDQGAAAGAFLTFFERDFCGIEHWASLVRTVTALTGFFDANGQPLSTRSVVSLTPVVPAGI